MRAEVLKERPCYELMKQSDVVKFYHLQFPRWLLEDSKYISISIEAKFVYMLLFNRFQLSKHNGWINDMEEVFVIYTRREMSSILNISEKRVSAAMNELRKYMLIWEKRCGRGFANQIYLANVKVSEKDAVSSKGGPLDTTSEKLRNEETTGLEESEVVNNSLDISNKIYFVDNIVDNHVENANKYVDNMCINCREPPKEHFKNTYNGASRTDNLEFQEQQILPLNKKEFNINNMSSNQSESSYLYSDEFNSKNDRMIIDRIVKQSEIDSLTDDEASVMRQAVERLYFSKSIKVGNAVYPNEYIRSNLMELDSCTVQRALGKLAMNINRDIRCSSAYVVTVLFNSIMEAKSDILVDPYINFLKSGIRNGVKGGG